MSRLYKTVSFDALKAFCEWWNSSEPSSVLRYAVNFLDSADERRNYVLWVSPTWTKERTTLPLECALATNVNSCTFGWTLRSCMYVCVYVSVVLHSAFVLCTTARDGNTLYRHSAAWSYKVDVPRACTRSRILPHRDVRWDWIRVRNCRHIGGSSGRHAAALPRTGNYTARYKDHTGSQLQYRLCIRLQYFIMSMFIVFSQYWAKWCGDVQYWTGR